MLRFSLVISVFLLAVFSSIVDANASRRTPMPLDAMQGNVMETSGVALAPLSFVRFCMDHRMECVSSDRPGELITLSEEAIGVMDFVNRYVNQSIRPMIKAGVGGFGRWAVNPAGGDCNDYAVSKRHELIKRGFPASSLLLAVARTNWGEGHLLLIVRTDKGDLVLDNLVMTIRFWDATGYTWIMMQSPVDPMRWEAVSQDYRSARVVAAIQKSRALARARAEKRREARLLLAETHLTPNTALAYNKIDADEIGASVAFIGKPLVSLGFDTIPVWAVLARMNMGGSGEGTHDGQPHFVNAQIERGWQADHFAARAQQPSMGTLTGIDRSLPTAPFTIALTGDDAMNALSPTTP